jgi:hypothetical protein
MPSTDADRKSRPGNARRFRAGRPAYRRSSAGGEDPIKEMSGFRSRDARNVGPRPLSGDLMGPSGQIGRDDVRGGPSPSGSHGASPSSRPLRRADVGIDGGQERNNGPPLYTCPIRSAVRMPSSRFQVRKSTPDLGT